MYAHSKVDHFEEEKSQFSCYRCDAGFKDEESIRKHFENCVGHDRKEPIIDRKMYVHEGKDSSCFKKEYPYNEKDHFHDKKEIFYDGKEYEHEKKEDVHEEKENIHEVKEYIKEEQELPGFIDEASLRNHVDISSFHNKPNNCDMKVATKIILKRHSSTIHGEKKTFECSICDMKFKARSTLKKHIHKIHENFTHEKKYFVQKGKQLGEIKPIGEENKSNKPSFENYIIANPDGTFSCIVEPIYGPNSAMCNAVFKGKNASRNAIRHFQTVHEKLKPFECAVCKKCFSSKQVLMRHYANIHYVETQPSEIQPVHGGKKPSEIQPDHGGNEPSEIQPVHEEKEPVYKANIHTQRRKKKFAKDYVIANANGTFECTICNARFNRLKNATRHFETVHEKIKPYECAMCKKRSSTKQVLIRHYATAHDTVKQNAEIEPVHEGKQSEEIEPLYEEKEYIHEQNYHAQKVKKKGAKEYITANSDGTFQCAICNALFNRLENATRHFEAVHEKIKPYECAMCKKRSSTKQVLIRHYARVHDKVKQNAEIEPVHEGKQPEEIEPLYEEKESNYEQNNHAQKGKKKSAKEYVTANSDGTFQCTICKAAFNWFRNATRHFETVHEKIKPYECAVCQRCFSSKQVLMRHHAKVHEGKNMCQFCNITFLNFDQLKDHILQFHTAKGKNSTSKEQIHDGKSGNYIEINKTKIQVFPLLPNGDTPLFGIKLSKKKLTKEKKKEWKIYQCNLCSMICLNNRELKNHIKRVHVSGLTESYLCEPCNMSFMSEEQFTEHARIIHNEKHENVEIQEVKDLNVYDEEENDFILPH